MYSGSKADKQFVLPKTSKQGVGSDSGGNEIFQDTSWWMLVNLKTARCVKDLWTPHGLNLSVLSNSAHSPSLCHSLRSEVWGLPAQQRGGLCQQRPKLQRTGWWLSVRRAGSGQPVRAGPIHGDGPGASWPTHLGDHRKASLGQTPPVYPTDPGNERVHIWEYSKVKEMP